MRNHWNQACMNAPKNSTQLFKAFYAYFWMNEDNELKAKEIVKLWNDFVIPVWSAWRPPVRKRRKR